MPPHPHTLVPVTSTILEPKHLHNGWRDHSSSKSEHTHRRWIPMGFLGGFYFSLGAWTYTLLTAADGTQQTPLVQGAAGIGFSVGLIMIVLTGAELFTDNCMGMMSVLDGATRLVDMAFRLLRTLALNFLGCVTFAALTVGMGQLGYPSTQLTSVGQWLCTQAITKAELNWWEVYFRGVLAALLICVGVLMAFGAKTSTGKMLSIIVTIACGAVLQFEHIIVNMWLFSTATMIGCNVSSHGLYWANFALSGLGNITGGWLISLAYFFAFVAAPP